MAFVLFSVFLYGFVAVKKECSKREPKPEKKRELVIKVISVCNVKYEKTERESRYTNKRIDGRNVQSMNARY